MDTIYLSDIDVSCILGCFPEERTVLRPVVISITLGTDISAAAASDDLHDAVDYNALTQEIIDVTQRSSFNLIESLAETIAAICLTPQGVVTATVTVTKPHPRPHLKAAAITITRQR